MLAARHRLIALHVDVDISRNCLCDLMNAVGPAAVGRGRHAHIPSVRLAYALNGFRIGGDDNVRQVRTRADTFVDMRQHWPPVDLTQDLARKPGRGQPCGDDGNGFHGGSVLGSPLVAQVRPRRWTVVRGWWIEKT